MRFIRENKNIIVMIICFIIIIAIGSSYALLRSSSVGTNPYTMNVGLLEVSFTNGTQNLTLSNAYPMTDEEGMEQNDELIFTIKNTGELDALYNVYIEETSTNPEFKSVIRYASSKDNGVIYSNPKTLNIDKYIEKNGLINVGDEVIYNVKMWLAEEADNTYMNKTFSAKIVVESFQKRNVVTFDANGGTVLIERMNVEYGENYGELPTPKREGYTFMGWNGKNMLNLSNLSGITDGVTINNNVINFDSSFVENNFASAVQIQKRLNYNYSGGLITWYDYELGLKTVNFTKDSSFNQLFIKLNGSLKDVGFYIGDFFEDGKKYTISLNFDSLKSEQCKATLSNLQLEEGNTATDFEPYYITSDTKVVQSGDHTLKAIWKGNE